MKYLNKFNEGFGQHLDEQELREFCEMYLAYLTDEGFEVEITKERENSITYYWKVKILKQESKQFGAGHLAYSRMEYVKFKWNSVKDQFIPFLQMVQKEYDFREDNIGRMCSIAWRIEDSLVTIPKQYILKELLEDKIETNFTFKLSSDRKASIQGNVGSIKLEILEEVERN